MNKVLFKICDIIRKIIYIATNGIPKMANGKFFKKQKKNYGNIIPRINKNVVRRF